MKVKSQFEQLPFDVHYIIISHLLSSELLRPAQNHSVLHLILTSRTMRDTVERSFKEIARQIKIFHNKPAKVLEHINHSSNAVRFHAQHYLHIINFIKDRNSPLQLSFKAKARNNSLTKKIAVYLIEEQSNKQAAVSTE